MASSVASALEKKFDTKVDIGNIKLSFLNRVTIDDFVMYDKAGKPMLKASRASAAIDLFELINGHVSISSAQLFGLNASITKNSEDAPYNFQFVIDSLTSKDTTQSKTDVHIASLVIRNGALSYDETYKPRPRSGFSTSHMQFNNISSHMIVYSLSDENIDFFLKNLSLKEQSGLDIRKLSLTAKLSEHDLSLTDLLLKLPHSTVTSPEISVQFDKKDSLILSSLKFKGAINADELSPSDIQPFFEKDIQSFPNLSLVADIKGDAKKATGYCKVGSSDKAFAANTSYTIKNLLTGSGEKPYSDMEYDVSDFSVSVKQTFVEKLNELVSLPKQLGNVGDISVNGNAKGSLSQVNGLMDISTSKVGGVRIEGILMDNIADFDAQTKQLALNSILENEDLGTITANAKIRKSKASTDILCNIDELEYHGYTYRNIDIDAKVTNGSPTKTADINLIADDVNLSGDINCKLHFNESRINAVGLDADISKIVPGMLNISDTWGNSSFAFNAKADIAGSSLDNISGKAEITDFIINGAHKSLVQTDYDKQGIIRGIDISTEMDRDGSRRTVLKSDFCNALVTGQYNISTLPASFFNLAKTYFPSLPSFGGIQKSHNNFSFSMDINSLEIVKQLTGADLRLDGNSEFSGYVNENINSANIYATIPSLTFYEKQVSDFKMLVWTKERNADDEKDENTLNATVSTILKTNSDNKFRIDLSGLAANDVLTSSIKWKDIKDGTFNGVLNSSAYGYNDVNGKKCFNIQIAPSDLMLEDSIWHIHSNDIIYSPDKIEINDFAIENNHQHIYLNGIASSSTKDSLVADLKDVNVKYILDLVDFHSVSFGGYASGRAIGYGLMSSPEAFAHLNVKNFLFMEGDLGTLDVDAEWNNKEKQVDIDGVAVDGESRLDIYGFVAPQRDDIALTLGCHDTKLKFIETFTKSFMSSVECKATGDMHLIGPISRVSLIGDVLATGSVFVDCLNCTYNLPGDTINLTRDNILLHNQPLLDKFGKKAYVSGGLHHKSFTQMTYDLDIDAEDFLAYDFREFGDDVFCGTAFMTGKCTLEGGDSELNVDVRGKADPGSIIIYNSSSPEAIASQEFITWNSANKRDNTLAAKATTATDEGDDDIRTDIHLNFLFNVDEGSILRVIMDERAGDYIDLHGTGDLRATYYNKGSFDMFGNYNVNSGLYHMTFQNVLRRDFEFTPGSSISFNGNPFSANLDLKAQYMLNSVPLSDLSIGESFSKNNVKVTCLMNIGGTAGAPSVSFDMDLPTVNSEAKQIIYSLINSEEEMNQQVLYLLSVGRFYAQVTNNASEQENYNRTNQMVQSVLSGTLSQQFGSIIGGLLNNNQWTLSANIAPGNEGFDNAEYEGIFSGSLLNNRLLVNGQVGYRDNANTSNQEFIGDFDVRYLLVPSGNFALRVYNQANDRYFTRNSMNTQGLGLVLRTEFNTWKDLFYRKKKK